MQPCRILMQHSQSIFQKEEQGPLKHVLIPCKTKYDKKKGMVKKRVFMVNLKGDSGVIKYFFMNLAVSARCQVRM